MDQTNHCLVEALAMLRILLSIVGSVFLAARAAADPLLNDDLTTCHDRQIEMAQRLAACEKLLDAGGLTGKDLSWALGVRANGYMRKRDYNHAIADFTAAFAADSDNVGMLNARGWAYEMQGKDDQAMADYNLALQKRFNFGGAYNNRGTLYLRKGALQSALDDFSAAVKFAPNMYIGHANRGRVLAITKDFDGAMAEFAAAIEIDQNAQQAVVYRCEAYVDMRRFDDAITDCSAVIAKVPNYHFALCKRAEAYMGKGNLDAALKDLNTVLGMNPNHIRAHVDRGQIFERRHDLVQARADYRSAAVAVTRYDDVDVAMARQTARERLDALSAQGPSVSAGRRIALVIGNGAYRNVHPLDNPPRDAKMIAASLRDLGFQTVTLSNDLTRDKFFESLRSFATDAEKADWAVIYYAGHGFEIGGVNYLVPVDARLAVDKDAATEAVALDQVIAAVGGARKLRLVMLDACRDNPFAPTMKHTIALQLVDKGFSDIEPSAGFMVVYAAKHGETALDGEGADSPFAVALAHDIKEPHVEVRKLFDIVRDDVWNATKHAQQPFTYGSPTGRDDFYFAGK